MPEFKFDDSEAVEFRLLPVGWYNVTVDNVEVTRSSTGKGMLKVLLRVDDGEYEGQPIFQNLMLEGRAGGITKAFLRAATGDPAGGSRDTSEIAGSQLRVRVTQKVWAEEDGGDGELQNNISKFAPLESDSVFG